MAAWALKSAVFLKNNGVRIVKMQRGRFQSRFEPPQGWVSTDEAAMLLKTYTMMIWRMIRLGRLEARKVDGRHRIQVRECLRIRSAWKHVRHTSSVVR